MKCKICGTETNGYVGLASHLHYHHITSKEYYDKFLKQENEGQCLECGKTTKFIKISKGYRRFCCCRCSTLNEITRDKRIHTNLERYGIESTSQLPETKEKIRKTNLERLGVDVPAKSKIVQDKMAKTNLKRYGHKAPMQSKEIQKKAAKTNLKRRGVKYPGQSEDVKEKIRKTNLERYGAENIFASEIIKEKIKETNLERYNAETWRKSEIGREKLREITGSKEFKQKCYDTKRKNNTFNKSKIERKLELELRKIFPDLKTQYKSEVYPFACDFYVPSLDLYIEYNGIWTHGRCFYDENNDEDRNTLEKWKQRSEHSKFYQNAIETWTKRDVLKLNTAIKNNLNYVVWFTKEQAHDWIEKYKKNNEMRCLICDKEFTSKHPKAVYCSRYHDLQCPVCGKMFSCRSTAIYKNKQNNIRMTCSRNCAKRPTGALLNRQPTKINIKNCEICGKEFITNHSKKKKYCSTVHKIKCNICGNETLEASKSIYKTCKCKNCSKRINLIRRSLHSNNEISICGFNIPTEEELQYYNTLTSKEKAEYTSLKHYGTKHPMQSSQIKEKVKNTTIDRYNSIGFASEEILEKYQNTCLKKYGTKHASQNEVIQNKIKQTNLERYGAENAYASEIIKEKIKKTNLERYGAEYSFQADTVKEKIKATNLTRYGAENPLQSPIIQEKVKNTNLQRYNVENVFQNKDIKKKIKQKQTLLYGGIGVQSQIISKKIRQTNLTKYGTTSPMQATEDTLPANSNIEILPIKKCYNTKKKNHTFNSSKQEKELEIKLKQLFPDLRTQYKSECYPFACDYYVPSLDLYIEYNGSWTHGGCFYDENDLNDLKKLNQWTEKSKNSKFYRNAIETWTVRDINKLNMALNNKLNYIAWFNQEQAHDWIEQYKENNI